MTKRMRMCTVAAVAVMMSGTTAGRAGAQAVVADGDRAVRIERAEVLADQALVLAKQARDFRTASSLLLEAAALRGPDRGAVAALVQAGHFAYYDGRGLSAMSAFRRAGETALGLGDREVAAEAFMNAAHAAASEGEWPEAHDLAVRSRATATTVTASRGGGGR